MKDIIPIIVSVLLLGEPQYIPLELEIMADLDALVTDTDFTLTVVADNGRILTHSTGSSSLITPYESASTSKWVTAAVIMWLVQNQTMSLGDNPQDYISGWPGWPVTGNLSQITLQHLLSFTSGMSSTPGCVNLPNADFEACVARIAVDNIAGSVPGEDFYYASTHMQVAGLMAIKALNVASWEQVFALFKAEFGLFADSYYNLPSATNPRLAGGMTWTASDYRQFLKKLKALEIIDQTGWSMMSSNQITMAQIVNSPGLNEWRYGLGLWLECSVSAPNCTNADRISSPGAYGAYPFIDYQHNYYGLIARQGELGTFDNGYAVFTSISAKLATWAMVNQD